MFKRNVLKSIFGVKDSIKITNLLKFKFLHKYCTIFNIEYSLYYFLCFFFQNYKMLLIYKFK